MKKWRKNLQKTLNQNQLVRIDRSPEIEESIDGYVVGLSDHFVMLHKVDTNSVDFDGYTILRRENIRRYRIRKDADCFLHRAIQLKGKNPVLQPQIDLTDLPSLLTSANAHYPLINISREIKDPQWCYIGRIHSLTAKTVYLDEINPDAQWDNDHLFKSKFKDVTKVEFGGAYEVALLLVADHESSQQAEPVMHSENSKINSELPDGAEVTTDERQPKTVHEQVERPAEKKRT